MGQAGESGHSLVAAEDSTLSSVDADLVVENGGGWIAEGLVPLHSHTRECAIIQYHCWSRRRSYVDSWVESLIEVHTHH